MRHDRPPLLAFVAGTFLLVGFVKGVIGLGLPTIAMGLLGTAMPPVQATALLVVPSLVTNLRQMAIGPPLRPRDYDRGGDGGSGCVRHPRSALPGRAWAGAGSART